MYKKNDVKYRAIASEESLVVRQSCLRVVYKLGYAKRFRNRKDGAKAARNIPTIACRLVSELARKMLLQRLGFYLPWLKLFRRVLEKKCGDSDKVYSLHEPDVTCYSKGKEHKKFEFGSKASLLVNQERGDIMGATNFRRHELLATNEPLAYRGKPTLATASQVSSRCAGIFIPKMQNHFLKDN